MRLPLMAVIAVLAISLSACSTTANPKPAGDAASPVPDSESNSRLAVSTRGGNDEDTTESPSSGTSELRAAPVMESDDADLAFWSSLAMPTAFEVEHFESLDSIARDSTVVVVGRVVDVGPSRPIKAEDDGFEVTYMGLTVDVLEVLRGKLDPDSGLDQITVESLTAMNDGTLPQAAAVMFLRHKLDPGPGRKLTGPLPEGEETMYRLVSSQGLLVSTSRGAENPISEALHAAESHPGPATGDHDPFDHEHDDAPTDPVAEEVRGTKLDEVTTRITESQ